MRREAGRRILIAALGLLAGLVLLWPLRLAPGIGGAGLAAASVEGSLWSGRLQAARWHNIALGDLRVGLSPLALLGGNFRLSLAGPAVRGAVLRGGTTGVAAITGDLALAGAFRFPLARLSLDGVDVAFRDGACHQAAGLVRLVPAGELAAATGGEALAGTIRCDGTQLLLPLSNGTARLEMRIGATGHYRARLALAGAVATQPALAAAGFQPTPDGAVATLEGDL